MKLYYQILLITSLITVPTLLFGATVASVEGESRILKKDSEDWKPVKAADRVEAGDQILTRPRALVVVQFDDSQLNILRIEENTMAEFRSIEPADIFLSDGSLFSQIESLTPGATYSIATPTAVASVRGTSFLRRFDASHREDFTQVESGTVELAPVAADGKILWEKKIVIRAGEQLKFNAKTLESNGDFRNLIPLTNRQLIQVPPLLPQTPPIFRSGKEEKSEKTDEA